jgi:uncharacterized phage infection (PIP) family protein YhgE
MADRKLKFDIGADIGPGSKAFQTLAKDAKKSMGDVDSAVDDTRTNAERVAQSLVGVFEGIDSTMTETKAAAEALATAMGPELSAKVDSAAAVTEFQKLGLTLDEIKAEADTLVTALKAADDVSLKHASGEMDTLSASVHKTRGDIDGVRDSSDQTKSVLANMVGNSTQDLAGLGGVAGTAGMALGQIGEYATEGGISVGNLAKLAGPMAALGVATTVLATVMDGIKVEKAFRADLVAGFRDEIKQTTTLAESLQKTLEETGDITFAADGGLLNLGKEMDSILPLMDKLGVSAQEVVRLMTNPAARAEITARREEWAREGTQQENNAAAWADLEEAVDQYGDSWDEARKKQTLADEVGKQLETTVQAQRAALDQVADDLGVVATRTDKAADSADDLSQAADDVVGSMDSATSAAGRLQGQTQQLDAQWQALQGTLDEDEAFLSLQGQFAAVHDSAKASYEAASTGAEDAAAKARAYENDVLNLKGQIVDYGHQIGLLPRDLETYLRLIDDGQISEMERRLAILTRNRDININLIQRGSAGYGAVSGARADGGPVAAGKSYLVGEEGPEIFTPPNSGNIIPNGQAAMVPAAADTASSMAGAVSMSLTIQSLNVTVPTGASPDKYGRDIADALARYVRINGAGPMRRMLGLKTVGNI